MSNCIISAYHKTAEGYGRIRYLGTMQLHHRVIYCLSNGIELRSIAGLEVMHTCDVPGCINPEHLLLGTHADNMADAANKGRLKGEKSGRAKLTEVQVLEIRANWKYTQKQLAVQYGISVPTIKDIIARKIWKHI